MRANGIQGAKRRGKAVAAHSRPRSAPAPRSRQPRFYSRKIVGWQFAQHMRTLVLDALRMALSTRQRVEEARLIHHSDRGSQYLSGDYTQPLTDHDVLASVGSAGNAYDSSLAESFKTELIADRVWQTRSHLELAIIEYISWFTDSRLHETSTTAHHERSKNSTLRKPCQPSP
jgi:transposase InsO family protein